MTLFMRKSFGDTLKVIRRYAAESECGTGDYWRVQTAWPCLGSHFVGIPFQHSRPLLSMACCN